jgi:hypothetical protein
MGLLLLRQRVNLFHVPDTGYWKETGGHTMSYKVVKKTVLHNCPTCSTELENPLNDAGQKDKCPKCGDFFVVPGDKELREETGRKAVAELKEQALKKLQKEETEKSHYAHQLATSKAQLEAKEAKYKLLQNEIAHLDVPPYGALDIVGMLFVGTGILSIIGGGFAFIAWIHDSRMQASSPDIITSTTTAADFSLLITCIIYGILAIGMGQACFALRDIAINSFHSANSLRQIIQKLPLEK